MAFFESDRRDLKGADERNGERLSEYRNGRESGWVGVFSR